VNFGQLQSLVSYYLDDLQFTYFTPTQVQRFINDAQREVQQKLLQAGQNFYLTCVQTPTVANQEGLALPDDFLKVEHCQIITGGTYPNEQYTVLTHSTHRESDFVNYAPSLPVTFFLQKNCLILRPVPDTSTYILRLHYQYRVADMVFPGEEPDVPQEYHEYIAVLAAIDGFLKDQRDPSPFFDKRTYYEQSLKQSSQDRMEDKPRDVVVTWDDF
jgi:hypothetical protein